jgi:uncharacterized protein YlxW (UPF0749 family)
MSKLLSVLIASVFAAVSYSALAEEAAPAPAATEQSEGSGDTMKAEHSKKKELVKKEKHSAKEKLSKKEKHSKKAKHTKKHEEEKMVRAKVEETAR